MLDEKQQNLLEDKVDRIEREITKLTRLVEGDIDLGVIGLREYIKSNEEWKRSTETLLKHRNSNIEIAPMNLISWGIILLLVVIILIFVLNSFRTSNPLLSMMNLYYGLNNWLYTDGILWAIKGSKIFR